jgi:hypothetical protein
MQAKNMSPWLIHDRQQNSLRAASRVSPQFRLACGERNRASSMSRYMAVVNGEVTRVTVAGKNACVALVGLAQNA